MMYYQHRGITIYCGKCEQIAPWSDFDLIITDPPYGISHPTDYLKAIGIEVSEQYCEIAAKRLVREGK